MLSVLHEVIHILGVGSMMRLNDLIPKYARPWLISMVCLNFFVYGGSRLATTGQHHLNMMTVIDKKIPLLPIFVVPYLLAFFQWGFGYVMICKNNSVLGRTVCLGEMIAKIIAGILFLLIPTTILRPEVTGHSVFSLMTGWIYRLDAADNLFPSIHCMESWICLRASIHMRTVSMRYKLGMGVMTILVFLSTIFLRQHVLADMVGAIAVAEIGLHVSAILFMIRARSFGTLAER